MGKEEEKRTGERRREQRERESLLQANMTTDHRSQIIERVEKGKGTGKSKGKEKREREREITDRSQKERKGNE